MNDQKHKNRPYRHPSAWKGSEPRNDQDWILQLGNRENDELAAALAVAKQRRKKIPELTAADFPLPTLSARIKAASDEIIEGRGFKLVRGFDIQRFSVEDAALIYWGSVHTWASATPRMPKATCWVM